MSSLTPPAVSGPTDQATGPGGEWGLIVARSLRRYKYGTKGVIISAWFMNNAKIGQFME